MANKPLTINLTIRGRDGVQVDKEDVFAVTSVNSKGLFDVLPEHENFISIIKDKVIVHRKGKPNQEIKLGTGVLEVKNNVVDIFLGMHSQ
jgi:F0F1-type ATP synthase epsilon subunit